jgi:DUF971 family protein
MPPREIRLTRDRRTLEICWADGAHSRLDAVYLRAKSRSSRAIRAALDECEMPMSEDLRITDVQLVGQYAVNLAFSDGDARGIYPWSYLRQLAGAAEDQAATGTTRGTTEQ